jgi:HAD superfamily hydrolase (TIGR01662 family)
MFFSFCENGMSKYSSHFDSKKPNDDYNPPVMHSPSPDLNILFFDFGGTLIYTRDPWEPIYIQADRALKDSLIRSGFPLGPGPLAPGFPTFLDFYYADRGAGIVEKTTTAALQEILSSKGFDKVPAQVLRASLDALFAVTQQNWFLEEDAVPTLKRLQQSGFHLGMISNTSDDDNVQQLLDRYELRSYFEHIVTSAACRIRKPDERIFRFALEEFKGKPSQAAMVGDALEADILGANRLGIYAIWITRRAENPDMGASRPDAVVSRLDQIPGLFSSSHG